MMVGRGDVFCIGLVMFWFIDDWGEGLGDFFGELLRGEEEDGRGGLYMDEVENSLY